jgi:transcriptional regulator with XRE-family HTH domain
MNPTELRAAREARGWSIRALSKIAGVPVPYLVAWERPVDPRVVEALDAVPQCHECGAFASAKR